MVTRKATGKKGNCGPQKLGPGRLAPGYKISKRGNDQGYATRSSGDFCVTGGHTTLSKFGHHWRRGPTKAPPAPRGTKVTTLSAVQERGKPPQNSQSARHRHPSRWAPRKVQSSLLRDKWRLRKKKVIHLWQRECEKEEGIRKGVVPSDPILRMCRLNFPQRKGVEGNGW